MKKLVLIVLLCVTATIVKARLYVACSGGWSYVMITDNMGNVIRDYAAYTGCSGQYFFAARPVSDPPEGGDPFWETQLNSITEGMFTPPSAGAAEYQDDIYEGTATDLYLDSDNLTPETLLFFEE